MAWMSLSEWVYRIGRQWCVVSSRSVEIQFPDGSWCGSRSDSAQGSAVMQVHRSNAGSVTNGLNNNNSFEWWSFVSRDSDSLESSYVS